MGPKKKDAKPEDEATIAARRKEQQVAAKKDLRQRMEAERNNSRINNLKIRNQWRKIMRLAKTEALKKDIEILSQNHERDIDRKDAILQMLDRDLEEAEDQYQMALRLHLQNMDSLIQLHDNRLYALERNFQGELKQTQTDVSDDKTLTMNKFKNEKHELNMVIEAIDEEEEGKNIESRHSFEQLREEIRNRSLEEINMLRISLDAQIEELENHFETAHLNYLQQTAQRTHDFKELTQTDQRLSKDIEVKRKKIDVLQTNIQQWRAKTRQLSRETEERNRLLKEEKQELLKDIIECERQLLLWEKKIQLEKETQAALDPDVGMAESRAMEREIHRMRLRYEAIKRDQDRMVSEMERAIYKREAITNKYKKPKNQGKRAKHAGDDRMTMAELKKKHKAMRRQVRKIEREIAHNTEIVKERMMQMEDMGIELEKSSAEYSKFEDEANQMQKIINNSCTKSRGSSTWCRRTNVC